MTGPVFSLNHCMFSDSCQNDVHWVGAQTDMCHKKLHLDFKFQILVSCLPQTLALFCNNFDLHHHENNLVFTFYWTTSS